VRSREERGHPAGGTFRPAFPGRPPLPKLLWRQLHPQTARRHSVVNAKPIAHQGDSRIRLQSLTLSTALLFCRGLLRSGVVPTAT
jgi:hypothetical protein